MPEPWMSLVTPNPANVRQDSRKAPGPCNHQLARVA